MLRAILATLALLIAPASIAQVSYPPSAASLIDQAIVTLDASGNATWTYSTSFPGVPAVVHLPKQANVADALICNWTSITQTQATVHCWRTNVASGLLTGLLGGATTGMQVTLVARYIP